MKQESAIKVLHIIDHLGLGGAQTFLLDLALEQKKGGRVVPALCCLREATTLSRRYQHLGLEIDHLKVRRRNPFEVASILPDLIKRIRVSGVDLVHTHLFVSGFFGRLAAKYCGVPVVVHEQRNETNHPNPIYEWLDRQLGSLAASVVCVSESTRTYNVVHKGIDPVKTMVIPNGLNLDRFQPGRPELGNGGADAGLDSPAPKKIVIGVGRLVPEKRFDVFLEAAGLIHRSIPEAGFLIVGEGAERRPLEQLVDRLGLSQVVRFTGERSDVQELLNQSDVFVLTSDFEGLPLTLLEALSLQIPAVATDVDGTGEVLAEGQGGVLVPPGTPQAVADAVIALLKDEDRREALGVLGRQNVEKNYSIGSVGMKIEKVYRSLLQPAPAAR